MPAVAFESVLPALPPSYDLHTLTDHEHDVAVATAKQLRNIPAPPMPQLRTSPQDNVVPFTIIDGPAAWTSADLRQRPQEWLYHLTPQDIEELHAAVQKVEASGIDEVEKVPTVTRDAFPLPSFGDKLRELAAQVSHGRGFQILRGVPVERYSRLQLVILWWGVGRHIGRVLPINKFGHLINHLHQVVNKDDIKGQKGRSPNTNMKQNFHSDQFCIDIVGMLSIGKALQGGDSRWVSSVTIHNELLRRGRRDLVEALTQQNFWIGATGYLSDTADRLVEPDGRKNYVPVSPFCYGKDGRLHVVHMGSGYYAAQEKDFVPRLSPLQLEALRTVQAIALDPDLHFRMVLQPGDIQWVHNTTMMHTRDGFTDGEKADEKRHLLRWWNDTSGRTPEELRAAGSLPCFGERLIDAAGGWPQPPGTTPRIVLDTDDKTKARFF